MVRPYLPEFIQGRPLVELNERCRFLCYKPNQRFHPHVDAKVQRPETHFRRGDQSQVTMHLYLHDLPEDCGGPTTFIREDGKKLSWQPLCGSALLFTHDLLHEGSVLRAGIKYTMRTDVMYGPVKGDTTQVPLGMELPQIGQLEDRVLSDAAMRTHATCLKQYGITYIPQMVEEGLLEKVQTDLKEWITRKAWNADRHMGFDGNSGETFLTESEAFSHMVANPTLVALVAAHFGTLSPHLSFERTYCIDPIDPYERRAFQWHHDGWGTPQLKVMILLSDVDSDGQCMHYCPGTYDVDWPCSRSRETLFADAFAGSLDAICCHGKAGDAFVFETAAVHRGVRNQTSRRSVMVLNFSGDLGRLYPIPRLHPRVAADLHPYMGHVLRQPVPGAVASYDLSTADLYAHAKPVEELLEQDRKRGAALWHGQALGGFNVDISRQAEIRVAGQRNCELMAKLSRPLNPCELYGIQTEDIVVQQVAKPLRAPKWFDWGIPAPFLHLYNFDSLNLYMMTLTSHYECITRSEISCAIMSLQGCGIMTRST